jgi:hypothetical protein
MKSVLILMALAQTAWAEAPDAGVDGGSVAAPEVQIMQNNGYVGFFGCRLSNPKKSDVTVKRFTILGSPDSMKKNAEDKMVMEGLALVEMEQGFVLAVPARIEETGVGGVTATSTSRDFAAVFSIELRPRKNKESTFFGKATVQGGAADYPNCVNYAAFFAK